MAEAPRIVNTGFDPRLWQKKALEERKRFSTLVVHRRGGKTVLAVNALIEGALNCRLESPRFAYVAPELQQARRVAWQYLLQYTRSIPGVTTNRSNAHVSFPNGARIMLQGADQPDRLRGQYFDGVVLDEVADMKTSTWGEVVRPCLTDREGWAIFIGTPKGLNLFSELYYRALREEDWYATRLTVEDTDTLPADEVARARSEMTESQFRQEFLCDFEAAVENALVSLEDARAAAGRSLPGELYLYAPKLLGVDVARFGNDSSVIARRQGLVGLRHQRVHGMDTMTVAGMVAQEAEDWNPDRIFIDVGGIGAGVYDRVRQLGFKATAVDFGSRATETRFMNLRSQMWWRLAEWIKTASIPNDERLISDLVSPTYSYANAAGKIALESKDVMRRRGVPSPDVADAYACTFAYPVRPRDLRAGQAEHDWNPLEDQDDAGERLQQLRVEQLRVQRDRVN